MVIRVLFSREKTKIIWIGKIIIDGGPSPDARRSKNGFSARNGDVGGVGH